MPKTTTQPDIIYLKEYEVTSDFFSSSLTNQIDLSYLLNVALETAGHHDRHVNDYLPNPLLKEKQSWVITQSLLQLTEWPVIKDVITVTTRVIEVNRFFVKRFFEIKRKNQLLMEITSQYAVIDLEARKMNRIDTALLTDLNLVDTSIQQPFDKLRAPEDYAIVENQTAKILPTDIDYNQHVNNTVYLRWCHEMLPLEIIQNYQLESVAVKYGSELLFDDHAEIELSLPENHLEKTELDTYQTVKNISNNKDACYLKLSWRKLNAL